MDLTKNPNDMTPEELEKLREVGAEMSERMFGFASTFRADTAGMVDCLSCGGKARWSREANAVSINCACGWGAAGSFPVRPS